MQSARSLLPDDSAFAGRISRALPGAGAWSAGRGSAIRRAEAYRVAGESVGAGLGAACAAVGW